MSLAQNDRRLEVSAAAWQVIVREGLDRTSMRAIAQEMSCTTGVVAHYFRNKQELILFALHQVTKRLQVLMEQAIANSSDCDLLVEMLSSFLPINQERQDILRVWVAFLGYAIGREDLMAEHRHSAGELRAVVIQELVRLQKQEIIRSEINLEIEANVLLALVNGVSLDTLIQAQHLSPEQQRTVLKRYVNTLLCNETV